MNNILTLSDISEFIVDCEHKTAPLVEHGIPSVRTTDLKNGRIILESCNRVSEDTYKEWTNRLEPQPGDIILSREAPVGEIGIVPTNTKICLGQRTVLIRLKKDQIVPRFLLYLFLTDEIRHELISKSEGSVVPHINMSDIRSFTLPDLPPLPTQHAIARILGSLDDKIDLNRQMNETLEAMARAIFQSWFVDFDPVWAKAEGRDTGLPAEVATLFPDGFEEVEGREVPKGWGVKPLSESFNVTMGQSPPGTTYNEDGEGMPFFQGRADFGFRYPSVRVYCTAPTRFAEIGDTLVSVRAPVGDINLTQERCCIGRGVAAVRHKTGSRSFTYYQMLSFKEVFEQFEAEGTVFGSIAKSDFNSIECITPPDEIVKKFEEMVFPIDQMIENNEQQSSTLARIRDALLPKLMSGELKVS